MKLEGSVVLVSGASRGIGRAVCLELAARGARLGLAARDSDALGEVAREVTSLGAQAHALAVDVSDVESWEGAVEAVVQHYRRLDAIVSCAGYARWGVLRERGAAEWRAMLEVNLLAPLVGARAALPHLPEGGHVVNIASVAALRPLAGNGVYAASKEALRTASESLRQELVAAGSKVRVTCITPGLVETEMTHALGDPEAQARVDSLRQTFPFLAPEDVARAVVFALEQPPNVTINEIVLRPVGQPV